MHPLFVVLSLSSLFMTPCFVSMAHDDSDLEPETDEPCTVMQS